MIKRITITSFSIYEKNKDGEDYTYSSKKDGKVHKFKRIVIKIDGENKSLSHVAFDSEDEVLGWQPGEQHDIVITQKGEYLNFDPPSEKDFINSRLDWLEKAVDVLLKAKKASETPDEKEIKVDEERDPFEEFNEF